VPIWTSWKRRRAYRREIETEMARVQPAVEEAEAIKRATTVLDRRTKSVPGPRPIHKQVLTEDGELACPECGNRMVVRKAKRGRHKGRTFWGCSRYPACNGLLSRR
jgi:hypothetical protein